MKIDYCLVKDILNAFKNPDYAKVISWEDVLKNTEFRECACNEFELLKIIPKFKFHMDKLVDEELISGRDGNWGIPANPDADNFCARCIIPLNITSKGEKFIYSLNQDDVFSKIINDSDKPFGMVVDEIN